MKAQQRRSRGAAEAQQRRSRPGANGPGPGPAPSLGRTVRARPARDTASGTALAFQTPGRQPMAAAAAQSGRLGRSSDRIDGLGSESTSLARRRRAAELDILVTVQVTSTIRVRPFSLNQ